MPPVSQWPAYVAAFIGGCLRAIADSIIRRPHD